MFMGVGFVAFACFFLLLVFDFFRFLGSSSMDNPVENTRTRAAIALTPISKLKRVLLLCIMLISL